MVRSPVLGFSLFLAGSLVTLQDMGGSDHKCLALWMSAALLLALSSGGNSQTRNPAGAPGNSSSGSVIGGGDAVFRTQVDRVVLHAAVFDRQQRLVTGLPQ